MKKYLVTRTYWKCVTVEAESPDEARVKACTECLFDDVPEDGISDVYDVEEVEEGGE